MVLFNIYLIQTLSYLHLNNLAKTLIKNVNNICYFKIFIKKCYYKFVFLTKLIKTKILKQVSYLKYNEFVVFRNRKRKVAGNVVQVVIGSGIGRA